MIWVKCFITINLNHIRNEGITQKQLRPQTVKSFFGTDVLPFLTDTWVIRQFEQKVEHFLGQKQIRVCKHCEACNPNIVRLLLLSTNASTNASYIKI
jgi:hypothetical protein